MTHPHPNIRSDDHDAVQTLMPWYVTGALDAADRAKVETHLIACAECQADLAIERRLDAEIGRLPIEAGQGWEQMLRRLEARPRRRASAWLERLAAGVLGAWRASPPWLGWALAAQACLVVVAGVALQTTAQPARYHTLGAAPGAQAGNVVVIFKPDTRESALRLALRSVDGRVVDGPTAADAYVLRVPAAGRPAALARLRGRADIVLAEPVDAGGPP